MRIVAICIIIIFFASEVLESQTVFNRTIDSVLSLSGLSRNDVSLPFFTNDDKEDFSNHKLLIGKVKESLLNPLNSVNFCTDLKELRDENFTSILNFLFKILNENLLPQKNIINYRNYNESSGNKYFEELCRLIKQNIIERENLLSVIDETDLDYLKNNLLEVLLNIGNNNDSAKDIFSYNRLRDSELINTDRIITLLSKIDRDKYYTNLVTDSYLFYDLYNYVKYNPGFFKNLKFDSYNNDYLKGSFSILKYSGLEIVIGDAGKNFYHGGFDIIIDLGGNDNYEIDNSVNKGMSWIIDLKGDDYYSTLRTFLLQVHFSRHLLFWMQREMIFIKEIM